MPRSLRSSPSAATHELNALTVGELVKRAVRPRSLRVDETGGGEHRTEEREGEHRTEEREGEHRRCAEERERDRGQRDARRSLRRSPLLPIEVRTPLVEGPHFPNLHHAPRHHTQARARLEQAEPAVPSAQLSELEELGAESRKSRMVFFGCAGRGGGEGRCVEAA